jgi:hypothetical protein
MTVSPHLNIGKHWRIEVSPDGVSVMPGGLKMTLVSLTLLVNLGFIVVASMDLLLWWLGILMAMAAWLPLSLAWVAGLLPDESIAFLRYDYGSQQIEMPREKINVHRKDVAGLELRKQWVTLGGSDSPVMELVLLVSEHAEGEMIRKPIVGAADGRSVRGLGETLSELIGIQMTENTD